jgi:hypothetical protein
MPNSNSVPHPTPGRDDYEFAPSRIKSATFSLTDWLFYRHVVEPTQHAEKT